MDYVKTCDSINYAIYYHYPDVIIKRHFCLAYAERVFFECDIVDTGGWCLTPFPGCLRLGLSWFNWWVSFAPELQCCYFCESSWLFYLSFNFDFYVSKIMHL